MIFHADCPNRNATFFVEGITFETAICSVADNIHRVRAEEWGPALMIAVGLENGE
jgi:hypothetical protein